jgi:hypothetical protein
MEKFLPGGVSLLWYERIAIARSTALGGDVFPFPTPLGRVPNPPLLRMNSIYSLPPARGFFPMFISGAMWAWAT